MSASLPQSALKPDPRRNRHAASWGRRQRLPRPAEADPRRSADERRRRPIPLNGAELAARRRDDHRGRRPPRRRDSAPLLQAGNAPRRQLPRVHGRDQGRARAGAVVLPRARRRHGGVERQRARRARAEDGRRAAGLRRAGARVYKPDSELDALAAARSASASRASRRARSRPPTSRTRRWRSTSTPASSARAACAPAARSRSTTSSATRSAARTRRSCSTSTTRWAQSTCVACGECVQACPTGALAPANDAYLAPVDRQVASVCPYCGVGCQLTYHVKDNAIVRVEGRDGPANHERLCVKGRFGFDYVAPSAAPDEAADPQRRRAEVGGLHDGSRQSARGVPRGDLGGGAGARRRHARAHPRHARRRRRSPASARPRAATRRRTCSRSSCAPASAPTTSTTARGCATRRASPRCSRASARARCRTR